MRARPFSPTHIFQNIFTCPSNFQDINRGWLIRLCSFVVHYILEVDICIHCSFKCCHSFHPFSIRFRVHFDNIVICDIFAHIFKYLQHRVFDKKITKNLYLPLSNGFLKVSTVSFFPSFPHLDQFLMNRC